MTLGPELSELPRLMASVSSFCEDHRLEADIAMEIELVLEEAVTNPMRHGFQGGGEHFVEVRMTVEDSHLVLQVIDDGIPYDPLQNAAVDVDAPIEERTVGGLGVHLIVHLMDEVDYQRVGDNNHLRMRKALG